MNLWTPTIVMYLLAGAGVAAALDLAGTARGAIGRGFQAVTAVLFWPLYLPILLTRGGRFEAPAIASPGTLDALTAAIARVDAELAAALDGWADGMLARTTGRIDALRSAWTAQAERIRAMDRLLGQPTEADPPEPLGDSAAGDRLRHSQDARRENLERLSQVRGQAYDDLMETLAWVRELVSMLHLARFTGAPAARAGELLAQIAAAGDGLWEAPVHETDQAPAEHSEDRPLDCHFTDAAHFPATFR